MKLALIMTVFLLTSCAHQSKQITQEDRYAWKELTCSGIKTWHDCYRSAQAVCPNGFYIVDQLENVYIQRREARVGCKA